MSVYLKAREVIEAIQTIESALDTLKKLPIYGFPDHKRGHWVPVNQDKDTVKHGRWVKISPANIYECSECGQNVMTQDIEAYKFCNGCGTKMDKEVMV